MTSLRCAASLLAFSLVFACMARADAVVSTCDEAHLNAAFTVGGTVTFTCSGAITVTSTKIIANTLIVDGMGQNVTISGGNSVQIFHVTGGNLTLRNLTISGGMTTATAVVYGGALQNDGTTTIDKVTFSGNKIVGINGATGAPGNPNGGAGGAGGEADGGAIGNGNGQSLTITNSTFSGNSAQGGAGGPGGFGTCVGIGIVPICSSFGGAGGTAGAANGGAISSSGSVSITNSTFAGNTSQGGTGGNGGGAGGVGLPITTGGTGGNGGSGVGGAVFSSNPSATLQDTTIASNHSVGGSGGVHGAGGLPAPNGAAGGAAGGGIGSQNGSFALGNTILSANDGGNCSATVADSGNNMSSDGTCSFGGPFNNTDPMLGTLANNGGPTQTFALLAGSPAIDQGNPGTCPPTDQRGLFRFGVCDIGAFELGGLSDFQLTAFPRDIRFRLGQQFSLVVAGFTDADPNAMVGSFSASINWGDGSALDSNTVISASTNPGAFDITGTHAYKNLGRYMVTVTIADSAGVSAMTSSMARMWPRPSSH